MQSESPPATQTGIPMTLGDANTANLEVILGRLLERADAAIPVYQQGEVIDMAMIGEVITPIVQLTGAISARTQSLRVMNPPVTNIHASQLREKQPLRPLGGGN